MPHSGVETVDPSQLFSDAISTGGAPTSAPQPAARPAAGGGPDFLRAFQHAVAGVGDFAADISAARWGQTPRGPVRSTALLEQETANRKLKAQQEQQAIENQFKAAAEARAVTEEKRKAKAAALDALKTQAALKEKALETFSKIAVTTDPQVFLAEVHNYNEMIQEAGGKPISDAVALQMQQQPKLLGLANTLKAWVKPKEQEVLWNILTQPDPKTGRIPTAEEAQKLLEQSVVPRINLEVTPKIMKVLPNLAKSYGKQKMPYDVAVEAVVNTFDEALQDGVRSAYNGSLGPVVQKQLVEVMGRVPNVEQTTLKAEAEKARILAGAGAAGTAEGQPPDVEYPEVLFRDFKLKPRDLADVPLNVVRGILNQVKTTGDKEKAALEGGVAGAKAEVTAPYDVDQRIKDILAGQGLTAGTASPARVEAARKQAEAELKVRQVEVAGATGKQAAEIAAGVKAREVVSPEERRKHVDVTVLKQTGQFQQPPAGITQGELNKGPYRAVSPDDEKALAAANRSLDLFSKVKTLADRVITAETPSDATAQWARLNINKLVQTDPIAATFVGDRKAFTTLFAREFGEKGVVTDRDVDRVAGAFALENDTRTTKDLKFLILRQLLEENRRAMIARVAGESVGSFMSRKDELIEEMERISPRLKVIPGSRRSVK